MTKKNITYKEAVAEIEVIMAKMESDELDVDELSAYVDRVAFLIKLCKEKLRHTEDEVKKIVESLDEE
ncbi:MAG TPA: exodeoxyribonuclease VII small subunit [Williamwhitmania sp.]|nr:exodeoxyribonuclease VII small subunit [Williamwhitmania sp.]